MLHVYLDMGLTLFKLGEAARVPLADFSLEGSQRKGLRYTYHRLNQEGCSFEVLPASQRPGAAAGTAPDFRRLAGRRKTPAKKAFPWAVLTRTTC